MTTPQPAAQRVAQRAAFMAQKVNLEVKGVIENMSLVHRRRRQALRDLRRRRRRTSWPSASRCRCSARCPLLPELREGGDAGHPIVVTDPDSEAAQAFSEIAERIDVELAPTRIYNPQLKII